MLSCALLRYWATAVTTQNTPPTQQRLAQSRQKPRIAIHTEAITQPLWAIIFLTRFRLSMARFLSRSVLPGRIRTQSSGPYGSSTRTSPNTTMAVPSTHSTELHALRSLSNVAWPRGVAESLMCFMCSMAVLRARFSRSSRDFLVGGGGRGRAISSRSAAVGPASPSAAASPPSSPDLRSTLRSATAAALTNRIWLLSVV
mmetsp:Transcript_19472/g.56016  ORF Transcript_19472/g.56016 Transcript_19472/m.56016 type:complete len:200 (-) Transcript_19472:231-830(-)